MAAIESHIFYPVAKFADEYFKGKEVDSEVIGNMFVAFSEKNPDFFKLKKYHYILDNDIVCDFMDCLDVNYSGNDGKMTLIENMINLFDLCRGDLKRELTDFVGDIVIKYNHCQDEWKQIWIDKLEDLSCLLYTTKEIKQVLNDMIECREDYDNNDDDSYFLENEFIAIGHGML